MDTQPIVRQRNEISYLYGENKRETALNMVAEMKNAFYFNPWDDEHPSQTPWTVNESLSNLESFSPRLRDLLREWNEYPGPKRLMIFNDNNRIRTGDLHLYYDGNRPGTVNHQISEEEKLELLEAMIDHNVYNDNGWKLDGYNIDPQKGKATIIYPEFDNVKSAIEKDEY